MSNPDVLASNALVAQAGYYADALARATARADNAEAQQGAVIGQLTQQMLTAQKKEKAALRVVLAAQKVRHLITVAAPMQDDDPMKQLHESVDEYERQRRSEAPG